MIGEFVRIQREKYGPDWKRILAEEMARESEPFVRALFQLRREE